MRRLSGGLRGAVNEKAPIAPGGRGRSQAGLYCFISFPEPGIWRSSNSTLPPSPPFPSPFISNHYLGNNSYLAWRISPTSPINLFLSLSLCQEWGRNCLVWQLSARHYGLTVPSALLRLVQSQGGLPKQALRGTVTYLLIWL